MVIDVRNLKGVIAVVLAALLPTAVGASEGSEAIERLCAITSTVACDLESCVRGPATAVNLPVFVKIDTENGVIETATDGGDRRASTIANVRKEGDTLLLLGGELEHGWSLALDLTDGSLAGTIVGRDTGYIVFGSCLAL